MSATRPARTWCVGMAARSQLGLPHRSHRETKGRPLPQAAATTLVGDSVPPMDIDEFYEADPRRRASAELELGTDWMDKDGVRHELELRGGHGRALRAARAVPARDRGPVRGAPLPGATGVRKEDHGSRDRQDRFGPPCAPDPRRVAGGHAGRPGRRLAGWTRCGRRAWPPNPGMEPESPTTDPTTRRAARPPPRRPRTMWAGPAPTSWPAAGWRCCWWPSPRPVPCPPVRRRGRRAGT